MSTARRTKAAASPAGPAPPARADQLAGRCMLKGQQRQPAGQRLGRRCHRSRSSWETGTHRHWRNAATGPPRLAARKPCAKATLPQLARCGPSPTSTSTSFRRTTARMAQLHRPAGPGSSAASRPTDSTTRSPPTPHCAGWHRVAGLNMAVSMPRATTCRRSSPGHPASRRSCPRCVHRSWPGCGTCGGRPHRAFAASPHRSGGCRHRNWFLKSLLTGSRSLRAPPARPDHQRPWWRRCIRQPPRRPQRTARLLAGSPIRKCGYLGMGRPRISTSSSPRGRAAGPGHPGPGGGAAAAISAPWPANQPPDRPRSRGHAADFRRVGFGHQGHPQ